MKRVFVSSDPLLVGHLRSVLRESGIECLIKNEHLAGGIGELPANECWPELWVLDDERRPQAERLIADLLSAEPRGREPWSCPRCGERLEAQFTSCWRCEQPPEEGGVLLA